jgi:uncharacterized membrane protein YhdT
MGEIETAAAMAITIAIIAAFATGAMARHGAARWAWGLTLLPAVACIIAYVVAENSGGYSAYGPLVLAVALGIVAFGALIGAIIGSIWRRLP